MPEKRIPMRMCIVCREEKPKREMLRVVKTAAGEISLDFSGKKAGRGAYLCDSAECVKKLRKGKYLSRAFSCEVGENVYLAIEEEYGAK